MTVLMAIITRTVSLPCGYCLEASMTDPARHSRVGGNPQGGVTARQTNLPNPLSLDGRGIKGEGDNKTVPSLHPVDSRLRGNDGGSGDGAAGSVILASRQYPLGGETRRMCHTRHCGLDPQSRGEGPG